MGTARRRNTGLKLIDVEDRRSRLRFKFFQAIRQHCPEPLYALRNEVYPAYCAFIEEGAVGEADPCARTFLLLRTAAPDVARLLLAWGERFNLQGVGPQDRKDAAGQELDAADEELREARSFWPVQIALETLWAWRFWPKGDQMMRAEPPKWVRVKFGWRGGTWPLTKVSVRAPSRETGETEAEWRERFHIALDRELDLVVETEMKQNEARGLVLGRGDYTNEKFVWLALSQVRGLTDDQIAEFHGDLTFEDSTIRKGRRSAARSLLLSPRPAKRRAKQRS